MVVNHDILWFVNSLRLVVIVKCATNLHLNGNYRLTWAKFLDHIIQIITPKRWRLPRESCSLNGAGVTPGVVQLESEGLQRLDNDFKQPNFTC